VTESLGGQKMSAYTFRIVARYIGVLSAILCVGFVVIVLVLLLAWGRSQEYTPEYVEHRLALGMTLEQVAYQLGLGEDIKKERLKSGGYRVLLTQAGLGSWFVPQYNVSLEFGRRGRLAGGYATVVYQLSDYNMALRLDES
jgi:hypothetical protein